MKRHDSHTAAGATHAANVIRKSSRFGHIEYVGILLELRKVIVVVIGGDRGASRTQVMV